MHLVSIEMEPAWIEAAKAGDVSAFSQLVLRHQAGVRAYLAVRLDDPHEAEDLSQEVFLLAFRRLNDFDAARPLGPWLRGIACNMLRNHLRKRRPSGVDTLEELQMLMDQHIAEVHESGQETDLANALTECLAQLDTPSRQLVQARYANDEDIAVICSRFGKRHSAITMQLHRIRLQLRSCIEQRIAAP